MRNHNNKHQRTNRNLSWEEKRRWEEKEKWGKVVSCMPKQSRKRGKEGLDGGKGQDRHIRMLCLAGLENLALLDVLIPITRAKDNVNCRECLCIADSGQNISSVSVKASALLVDMAHVTRMLFCTLIVCSQSREGPLEARFEDGESRVLAPQLSCLPSSFIAQCWVYLCVEQGCRGGLGFRSALGMPCDIMTSHDMWALINVAWVILPWLLL